MSVVMNVKPGCPYCQAARDHFAAEGEIVEERDATQSAAWGTELTGYTKNPRDRPTIVWATGSAKWDSRQVAAERCIERSVARWHHHQLSARAVAVVAVMHRRP
jgi:glutaredoxin